jgi:hypothetical protein
MNPDESPENIIKKPKKAGPKKGAPRTEAQMAATKKAFESLQKRREELKADLEREEALMDENAKAEKAAAKAAAAEAKKKSKFAPVPQYVTVSDLNAFKNDLMQFMPKTVVKEVPGPERIVYRDRPVPVDKVEVKEVVKEKPVVVSGNELLDKIFFKK